MTGKGAGSRVQKWGEENAKPELQGKDPKNKNVQGKLSGKAFIILLFNWFSEQFHVVFVPDGLEHSPSSQSQDRIKAQTCSGSSAQCQQQGCPGLFIIWSCQKVF